MQHSLVLHTEPPLPWTTAPVDAFICALDAASDTCCYEPQEIIFAVKKAFPALKDHVITKSEVERRLRILDARIGIDYFKPSSVPLGVLQNTNRTGTCSGGVAETAETCTSSIWNNQDAAKAAVVAARQPVTSQEGDYAAEGKDSGKASGKEDRDNIAEEDSRGVRHGLAIHSISIASSSPEEQTAVAEKERGNDITLGLGSGRSTIRKVMDTSPPPSSSSPAIAALLDRKANTEKGVTRMGLREWLHEIGGVGDGLELSRAVKHGLAMQFTPGNNPLETLPSSSSGTTSSISAKKPESDKENVDYQLPSAKCVAPSVSKLATLAPAATPNEQNDRGSGLNNVAAAADTNNNGNDGTCGVGGSGTASIHNDNNKARPAASRLWQSQTSRRVSRDADFKVHLRSSIVYRVSSSSSSSSSTKNVNNDQTGSSCPSCTNSNNDKTNFSCTSGANNDKTSGK